MIDPDNTRNSTADNQDTVTPETPGQRDQAQTMKPEAPREGAEAHTHDEPNTERLAQGGPHPEPQPRTPQDTKSDGAMSGDHGQTRQPQSSGMIQPDGGVNQGSNQQP